MNNHQVLLTVNFYLIIQNLVTLLKGILTWPRTRKLEPLDSNERDNDLIHTFYSKFVIVGIEKCFNVPRKWTFEARTLSFI